MARDSVLVVWSEEEAYYLHCLSLSRKEFPEVTFSIAESGACVQKLMRNMNFIVGGASTIRDGKKCAAVTVRSKASKSKAKWLRRGGPFPSLLPREFR